MGYSKDGSRLLSKLISYHVVLWLVNENRPIYLPHTCDFRGRLYSNSLISPIYNKILRPGLVIGHPPSKEELMTLEREALSSKYYTILNRLFKFSSYKDYLLTGIRLEIGKLGLKGLVSIKNPRIPLKDISIEGGFSLDKLRLGSFDFTELGVEDRVYIKILYVKYRGLLSGEIPEYIPCLLDATASGQQVLTIILGQRGDDLLSKLNLSNSLVWTDTYLSTLKTYREYLVTKEDPRSLGIVDKYFTRKLVKGPIMTIFYNSTEYRTLITMREHLLTTLDYSEVRLLTKSIRDFHSFIATYLIKSNFKIETLLDIESKIKIYADLNYYVPLIKKDVRYKITINGEKRSSSYTHTVYELKMLIVEGAAVPLNETLFTQIFPNQDPSLLLKTADKSIRIVYVNNLNLGGFTAKGLIVRRVDLEKTRRAKAPNLAHYVDSDIVVHVLKNSSEDVYTIHDMYISNMSKKHRLYLLTNEYFSIKLNMNIFSPSLII